MTDNKIDTTIYELPYVELNNDILKVKQIYFEKKLSYTQIESTSWADIAENIAKSGTIEVKQFEPSFSTPIEKQNNIERDIFIKVKKSKYIRIKIDVTKIEDKDATNSGQPQQYLQNVDKVKLLYKITSDVRKELLPDIDIEPLTLLSRTSPLLYFIGDLKKSPYEILIPSIITLNDISIGVKYLSGDALRRAQEAVELWNKMKLDKSKIINYFMLNGFYDAEFDEKLKALKDGVVYQKRYNFDNVILDFSEIEIKKVDFEKPLSFDSPTDNSLLIKIGASAVLLIIFIIILFFIFRKKESSD